MGPPSRSQSLPMHFPHLFGCLFPLRPPPIAESASQPPDLLPAFEPFQPLPLSVLLSSTDCPSLRRLDCSSCQTPDFSRPAQPSRSQSTVSALSVVIVV